MQTDTIRLRVGLIEGPLGLPFITSLSQLLAPTS